MQQQQKKGPRFTDNTFQEATRNLFMKIVRYDPSGEIYGAENNLEAVRLQHLQ